MSLINTSLSGLLAAQAALDVTANNVANASNPSYVRRQVQLAEAPGSNSGVAGNIGNGVSVTGIQRQYDQFLGNQVLSATSSQQSAQTFSDLATSLDNLLGNTTQNIGTGIQDFINQVSTLSQDPTSATNRQQVLLQASALGQTFQQMNSQLDSLDNQVTQQLRGAVTQINNLAASIAQVNVALGKGSASNTNDLQDQRQQLLTQLTQQVDATVISQPDGSINVLIGGQPIVLGAHAMKLATVPDQYDASRQQIAIVTGDTSQVISRQISGGTLGGLLSFQSQALDPAQQQLGAIAQTLTSAVNAQNHLGVDANGNPGGNIFSPIQAVVLNSSANTGNATANASITDPSALQARDYVLKYNGTAWQLTDAATGAALPATGTGTASDPLTIDGVSITVGGTPAAGDSFLVRPVNGAAGNVSLATTDPASIAAAAALTSVASSQNSSLATITPPTVYSLSNPNLRTPVRIVFSNPTTFQIQSTSGTTLSGPLTYTAGQDISFNGWTVQVSGAPSAGDSFSVSPTGSGSGDNSNALALAGVLNQKTLQGGTQSVGDLANGMLDSVGATTQRATQNLQVQTSLQQQVQQDFNNVSGVDLNEEAAKMLQYQQAYLAASKMIGVADQLFQAVINVL